MSTLLKCRNSPPSTISSLAGKGQTGLELVIVTVMALLAFSMFYSFLVDKRIEVFERETEYLASSIAEKAAYEINIAVVEGDGFTRNFTLPESLYGVDYDIIPWGGFVFVNWTTPEGRPNTRFASIIIENITSGYLNKGENNITNVEGEIYVNVAPS